LALGRKPSNRESLIFALDRVGMDFHRQKLFYRSEWLRVLEKDLSWQPRVEHMSENRKTRRGGEYGRFADSAGTGGESATTLRTFDKKRRPKG
jgi:hypothetical protein